MLAQKHWILTKVKFMIPGGKPDDITVLLATVNL